MRKNDKKVTRENSKAVNKFYLTMLVAAIVSNASAEDDVTSDGRLSAVEVEEVLVTGFRSSLKNAMAQKRDTESIVEAVAAEDIGKLPDVSIAESLARLPGLAAQRLNGRSQLISVRGLAPDFTNALLNGRQQVSSGDNRSIEFDQYPSELLSGVLVHKTPQANLLGQGLAATVNMKTIRPLEQRDRTIAFNGRYEWNDMAALNEDAEKSGERLTFTYIDQYADGVLGLAIGASHLKTPTQGERFNAWGYPEFTNEATGESFRVIGGAKPFVQTNILERDAVIGVLEYQPNEIFSSSLDVFYSDFHENQLLRGIEFPLAWSSAELAEGFAADANGFITSGEFSGVGGVMRNDAEVRNSTLFATGLNMMFNLPADWELTFDVSHSESDRTDQVIETYSGIRSMTDTLSFQSGINGTVFNTSLDYGDPDLVTLTNVQNWGGAFVDGSQEGFYKQPASTDELSQIRIDVNKPLSIESLSFLQEIEFGLAYDTRKKDKTTLPEYFIDLPNAAESVTIPVETSLTRLDFLGVNGMVSYDPFAVYGSDTYELVPDTRATTYAKAWSVEEDVTSAFVQLGIDGDIGDVGVTGNVGVQFVRTEQSSAALAATGDQPDNLSVVPVSGGKAFNEILPSLNLNFELFSDKYLRLGLARTLQRARMDELRASQEFNFDSSRIGSTEGPWSASGGNPELDPWIANNIDISYEHYFTDDLGYFALAAFYKDLDTYIYNSPVPYDFSAYPVPDGVDTTNLSYVGSSNIPENGKGGSIDGYELSLSLNGKLISPVLSSVGATLSASFTNSEIQPNPDDDTQPLPGLSENVYNLTVYYENEGLSARVSGRYRSEFLGEVSGFDARRTFRYVDQETIVDAQLSYAFNDGGLEGLKVFVQGNNLTDEPFVTTEEGDSNRVIDYQRYGPTFALGASYKY